MQQLHGAKVAATCHHLREQMWVTGKRASRQEMRRGCQGSQAAACPLRRIRGKGKINPFAALENDEHVAAGKSCCRMQALEEPGPTRLPGAGRSWRPRRRGAEVCRGPDSAAENAFGAWSQQPWTLLSNHLRGRESSHAHEAHGQGAGVAVPGGAACCLNLEPSGH